MTVLVLFLVRYLLSASLQLHQEDQIALTSAVDQQQQQQQQVARNRN
jgi:hypothetical protein